MGYKITISIDDVNPKKGWRILGDETEKYLFALNKEFGCKFTLFIPSNHHGDAPISKNKAWIDELKDTGIFELAAHGHYHQCSSTSKFGEMEFLELTTKQEVESRIKLMLQEWGQVDHSPVGWRNPGWFASPESVKQLDVLFDYVAIHNHHNSDAKWECKTLKGHSAIHEERIQISLPNHIMFQSHIAGDWNKNVWNLENSNNLRGHLHTLDLYPQSVIFKTLSEL